MQIRKNYIRKQISSGRYVEYKSISICKINDFYSLISKKIMYQVHCTHPKYKHSALYEDIEEAIDKFTELRKNIR